MRCVHEALLREGSRFEWFNYKNVVLTSLLVDGAELSYCDDAEFS